MSNDKPINAMYGSKMKLDLEKLKNNREKDDKGKGIETKPIKEVSEEPIVEDAPEEVAEETIKEESMGEAVKEKPSKNVDSSVVDSLKTKLGEREKKLSNQSSELNYLTNKLIPKLKKENANLKDLKIELTDALEKSTRKYFDQLDINADLSNKIGKIGAEGAVNKVRANKFEAEVNSVKEELQTKINQYKEKLDSVNIDGLKKENNKLSCKLRDIKIALDETKKENMKLSEEVKSLREEIIEIGNYKQEVDNQNKKEIEGYKEEISSMTTKLRLKESSYDKLFNESSKTISNLRKQVSKLEEALEKESNRGLFNRFK